MRDEICRLLLRDARITSAALDRAERLRGQGSDRLDLLLAKLGLVSDRDLAAAYARQLGLGLMQAADFPPAPVLEERLSRKFLKQARVVPVENTPEELVVAMADPLDDFTVQALGFFAKKAVVRRVALPADVDAAFERLYGEGKSAIEQIVGGAGEGEGDGAEADVERLKDLASEAPVIRIVNHLITRAVEARASDVHIEPADDRMRVRYRVDGLLREVEAPPRSLHAAIVSRVKILANLNIAERRLAQDGRVRMAVRGKEIDLRVSTTPTMHGESVVMRILDRGSVELSFDALGFDGHTLGLFLQALNRPHGILLVTGPTGSGKTTTLYTSLVTLNTPDKKILTIEDPIEYQLDGINQTQVKPQIGLSFASALRSFLRQDPDVMMIGEIRDLETARIAVQAALTGHVVLSTLHTNDAASAVTRLLDMGLEDYLLTSSINGLVGQRLVRRLCPACKQPEALPEATVRRLGLEALAGPAGLLTCAARGCAECGQTGFLGRTSIVEVLLMTDAIRDLVLRRAPAREIQKAAVEQGMRTMFQDGLLKVVRGETTLDEVVRVTQEA